MVRTAILTVLLVGFALTGFASLLPAAQNNGNTLVAAKVDLIAQAHPHRLILQKCALEDCSDTPQ